MTELEEIVRTLESQLESASRQGDRRRTAELFGRLGSNLAAIGKRDRALEALNESVALYAELGTYEGVHSLNRLGAVLISMQRLNEARPILARALEAARFLGDKSAEATSLNNLAMLEEIAGDLPAACGHYARSIELLRDGADPHSLATSLNNLAVAYGKSGRYEDARRLWEKAIALFKQVQDRAGLASALNNVGLFMQRSGEATDAAAYLARAIAIQQEVGDKGELVLMLGNLAHAYTDIGRYGEALELLNRKLALQDELEDANGAAVTLHVIANALGNAGLRADAYRYYTRAVDSFTALGRLADAAHAEMDRAFVATDEAIAVAHGEHSVSLRAALGDSKELAAALDSLGVLYGEAGNYERAIALMERSLALAQQAGDVNGVCAVLCNLGAVCEEAKLRGEAISYYEQALPLIKGAAKREDMITRLDALRAAQV